MSKKILMVCLGNICRSPIAHGLLQHKANQEGLNWEVDSAGLLDWHEGELPHPKSIAVMKKYGIDISYQRSRPFARKDLHYFDLIYVMDESNYRDVIALSASEEEAQKVKLILNEVYPAENRIVPDPYGKSDAHYEQVYAMLDEATDKIIRQFSEK